MLIARAPRGMNDLYEPELFLWRKIEDSIKNIAEIYGFQEIRTPILEDLTLFKRGVGEGTDIVEKEMFIVPDKDIDYCLRPENTASVVRALIERGGLSADSIEKYYYLGPMFRKERPQRGRLRQFHQFGMETFGVSEAVAEIEILRMVDQLLKTVGIKNIILKINTLGNHDERLRYKEQLKDYFSNYKFELCEDCKRRLLENPLRILDCKNESCQKLIANAPSNFGVLGKESRMHFDQVIQGVNDGAVPYEVTPHLVRGLDYYNQTVFEFVANSGLGAQNTVVAGGRYNGLFKTLGNKIDLPAVGCAGGIERMALLLDENADKLQKFPVALSLIGADDAGQDMAMKLSLMLRQKGIAADFSLAKRSVKAQMRRADKLNAHFVGVIGENEIKSGKITVKNLRHEAPVQEIRLEAESMASFILAQ
jgi:histidyl-tRNA synthetase